MADSLLQHYKIQDVLCDPKEIEICSEYLDQAATEFIEVLVDILEGGPEDKTIKEVLIDVANQMKYKDWPTVTFGKALWERLQSC